MQSNMVDKVVELDDDKNYLILDSTKLENVNYYYAVRLDENDDPTNHFLFFEESLDEGNTYFTPVEDEATKGLLLTVFTVNLLDKVYDM